MPVLQVWKVGTAMFIKRSRAFGYAGIDNPLFCRDNDREHRQGDVSFGAEGGARWLATRRQFRC
jgi:NAD(P) transhydrogenase beta subunit